MPLDHRVRAAHEDHLDQPDHLVREVSLVSVDRPVMPDAPERAAPAVRLVQPVQLARLEPLELAESVVCLNNFQMLGKGLGLRP